MILIVGVGLWIARGGPGNRWLASYWILLVLGSMAGLWFWFILVPKASLRIARGNSDVQRRILQCVANTPAPEGVKLLVRFMLGVNNQVARRYAEAEAQYQSIIGEGAGRLEPGFESVVRQHLGDTLEALGRHEAAVAEREQAGASLRDTEETSLGLQAKGRLLDREHRYAEAYAAYERALALAPPNQKAVYAELMMRLVLSSFNAGRPADSLRWAEAVIAIDAHSTLVDSARRMAAVACSNMGRLDEAERHVQLAAQRAPSDEKRAESLALLGSYMMRRGDLDQAERSAREAEAINPGKKRMPWIVIGLVAKERGHVEDAIRALECANTIHEGHIPAMHRRASAVIHRDLAILHAELGHGDAALALIRHVEPEFAGDPKLSVTLDASAALVHALRDERDLALARIAAAEEGRRKVPADGTTQKSTLSLLGRAALRIDLPERAESFLRAYLELKPDPLYLPFAFYHLAECRRRIGDEAGGREFDTKAAATRFGSQWERLARERLAALGATV